MPVSRRARTASTFRRQKTYVSSERRARWRIDVTRHTPYRPAGDTTLTIVHNEATRQAYDQGRHLRWKRSSCALNRQFARTNVFPSIQSSFRISKFPIDNT